METKVSVKWARAYAKENTKNNVIMLSVIALTIVLSYIGIRILSSIDEVARITFSLGPVMAYSISLTTIVVLIACCWIKTIVWVWDLEE